MFKTHRTFDLSTGVKNNSIAVINDFDSITVIYHKTRVVVATQKGIKLSNDGWDTISTRIVINRALKELGHGDIFLERVKGETKLNLKGERIHFESGDIILAKNLKKAA